MLISEVLTRPAAETRVMIKQYRFHPLRVVVDAAPDVWLDSGNLADWLGDAISRGTGQLETVVLSHRYLHLAPLVTTA